MKTGKFIAKVTVSGRAMDSKGNIISRDTNGLPPIWLNVEAGSIPNRQTITGSVAQRMGIPIDTNGIIAPKSLVGQPYSFRIIYGSWLESSEHEQFGIQYTWTVIKDMTEDKVRDLEEAIEYLGKPDVFIVEKPNLPQDYQRKTEQHIGRAKLDSMIHGTAGQSSSNVVEQALDKVGAKRSDTSKNPEVTVGEDVTEIIKKNKVAK